MPQQTNKQTMHQFVAGKLYDGSEIIAFLQGLKAKKPKKKRNPTAYNCFIASIEQRELLKCENPEITPKQIMSALAAKWQSLTKIEKNFFEIEAIGKAFSNNGFVAVAGVKKKRTPSAYNRFIADKERRSAIKLTNPDALPNEVMSLMAAQWKTLSDTDKANYIDKATYQ